MPFLAMRESDRAVPDGVDKTGSDLAPRLLRWCVIGLVAAWVLYVVLLLTSSQVENVVADIAWPLVLLAPTTWAYVKPGPLSGAVAVLVAWPLAALTVTSMIVLPVLVVAEAMLIVAALRGGASSPPSREA